jgi:hypothetical protein
LIYLTVKLTIAAAKLGRSELLVAAAGFILRRSIVLVYRFAMRKQKYIQLSGLVPDHNRGLSSRTTLCAVVYSKQQGRRFAKREVVEAGALWPQHRTVLFSCAALCLGTKIKSASERQFIK